MALGVAGCPVDEEIVTTEPTRTPGGGVSSAPASSPKGDHLDLTAGWRQVELPAKSPEVARKVEAAKKAMKALGQNLQRELKAALGETADFEQGIKTCQEAAPKVAQMVAGEHQVEVGRTSFKVRNPLNRPRPWARPVVEQRYDKPVLMEGPDGRYAFMAPIRMGGLCVSCHGTPEQIPDAVQKLLAERYPEDQATGFGPTDLRGWFWVEFASATATP